MATIGYREQCLKGISLFLFSRDTDKGRGELLHVVYTLSSLVLVIVVSLEITMNNAVLVSILIAVFIYSMDHTCLVIYTVHTCVHFLLCSCGLLVASWLLKRRRLALKYSEDLRH